ncbi:hypothetical protein [Cupriavidus basilensis]|nr:hypothetical protein [Cupriavidus basilensis]
MADNQSLLAPHRHAAIYARIERHHFEGTAPARAGYWKPLSWTLPIATW